MPKINHIIFFTIITVNLTVINAMETVDHDKKDIVIAIEHDGIESNNEHLPSIFNTDQYIIMKSYSASKACTEAQFNNQITSIIEGDVKSLKQKNSDRKVYLYAAQNSLYSLNYAAQNAKTIDGIILYRPTYFQASQSSFKRLFNLKLSRIVEQLPNTIPIVIYSPYATTLQIDKIFKALLVFAENRKIHDIKANSINHNTFSIKNLRDITIPLQNPEKNYNGIYQLSLVQEEIDIAQTIRQEETKLYYIERFLLGVGSGFFVFLFHKMGIFYLLYGASTMLLNQII